VVFSGGLEEAGAMFGATGALSVSSGGVAEGESVGDGAVMSVLAGGFASFASIGGPSIWRQRQGRRATRFQHRRGLEDHGR
jgi:hypothetical protein